MLTQFDVHELAARPPIRHCIILNGAHYTELETLLVLPLIAHDPADFALPIYIQLDVQGQTLTTRPDLIASVPRSVIGKRIMSHEDKRFEILGVVDRLLAGY